jgi:hypothetical protein
MWCTATVLFCKFFFPLSAFFFTFFYYDMCYSFFLFVANVHLYFSECFLLAKILLGICIEGMRKIWNTPNACLVDLLHLFSALANSPNASRIQVWRVKIQTHSPAWQGFFPLSLTISVVFWLDEWNFLTTRQFGECLEKLIHTPVFSDVLSGTLWTLSARSLRKSVFSAPVFTRKWCAVLVDFPNYPHFHNVCYWDSNETIKLLYSFKSTAATNFSFVHVECNFFF